MATPIRRIEKDFLLKVLYDEQLPVICIKGRIQYILTLEKTAGGQLFFRGDRSVKGLNTHRILDLMFYYHGKIIRFSAEISSVKDDHIITGEPEFLYRNLARSFSRVPAPLDLKVQFAFLEDPYSLSCPRVPEYESDDCGELTASMDLWDVRGIIRQIEAWIMRFASGQKIFMFRDTASSLNHIEEKIIAETGKALFLPSTLESYPAADPHPKKRIITEELFKRYLESTGIDPAYLDEACARFVRKKFEQGILSDLWVPIRFHEYVVGYIHSWINEKDKAPFDYGTLDKLRRFSKILVGSYKINGYFESGKVKNDPFNGKIVDISASGLLFTYPNSQLATALLPDRELTVKLKSPSRTINARAKIVRRYRDSIQGYFGCRFTDMEQEDLGFLFECIYGKTFTESNTAYLSGQV